MKQITSLNIKTLFSKVYHICIREKRKPEVIVSLTSYPPRINCLQPTLETIFRQNRKPDKIVLWLASSEFPNREADLPEYLITLSQQGKIIIEWCENLGPHKKYFYALQKYRDDIVITIDDDLLYPRDMIKCLLASYKKFPRAVSALRCHMMLQEGEKFADYARFTQQQNDIIGIPSMRLLATNGAGSLFPPNLLDWQYFDEKLINELSLYTDDLWLKIIEVLSGVPVVQPRHFSRLHYVENSQNIGLFYDNTLRGGNDRNLENIGHWADAKFGKGFLLKKIFIDELKRDDLCYRQLSNKKTILYFVPHQDDELLTMGIDICSAATRGHDVHVILCTDGRKSNVRLRLNDKQSCSLHQEPHVYELDEDDFIKARDAEFIDSCLLLGVPQANIHIATDRAVDGKLEITEAENIIKRYMQQYGQDAEVNAIYFANGKNQHKDHKALGRAVYNLWRAGLIRNVKFFREPYCSKSKGLYFVARHALPEVSLRVCYAIYNYKYWAPNIGRYAIGYHSVPYDFEKLMRKMKVYYRKMHRWLFF